MWGLRRARSKRSRSRLLSGRNRDAGSGLSNSFVASASSSTLISQYGLVCLDFFFILSASAAMPALFVFGQVARMNSVIQIFIGRQQHHNISRKILKIHLIKRSQRINHLQQSLLLGRSPHQILAVTSFFGIWRLGMAHHILSFFFCHTCLAMCAMFLGFQIKNISFQLVS